MIKRGGVPVIPDEDPESIVTAIVAVLVKTQKANQPQCGHFKAASRGDKGRQAQIKFKFNRYPVKPCVPCG